MNVFTEIRLVAAENPGSPCAVDTETTSINDLWRGLECRGVSLALGEHSWYLPLTHPHSENLDPRLVRHLLLELSGQHRRWVWYNSKYDWAVLETLGLDAAAPADQWDCSIGRWLEDENRQIRDLKGLSAWLWPEKSPAAERDDMRRLCAGPTLSDLEDEHYYGTSKDAWDAAGRPRRPMGITRAQAKAQAQTDPRYGSREMWDLTAEEMAPYAAQDAALTLRMYHYQRSLDHQHPIGDAMPREMEVARVLLGMERTGIRVDEGRANAAYAAATTRLKELENLFEGTNLNAPHQIAELVYEKWGFSCPHLTEAGNRSVDRDALELLGDDQRIVSLLECRRLLKAISGYYKPLIHFLDDQGRIHPTFNQAKVKTGRFSCVAADTLVEMPRDLAKYPDGVPITEIKAGDWVYAFDWERELVLRRVKWVGQTGIRQTFKVTFENSEGHQRVLRLTPDHLVRLRNGDWRAAGQLHRPWGRPSRDGPERVMTMVRRALDDNGYVRFFPHSIARRYGVEGGGKVREHRWVAEQVAGRRISTKADVHHRDGNRANNHPDNLEPLPVGEHRGQRHVHPNWGAGTPDVDFYCGPTDYRPIAIESWTFEPVWDMEVEDVHNFIANGICVHNCERPNLQTIPRDATISEVRKIFVPSDGYELWEYDLSQAELRVSAALAGEARMISAFAEGRDVYQEVADEIWCVKTGCAKKAGRCSTHRQRAKTVVLAFSYGQRERGLAASLLKGTGQRVTPEHVNQAAAIQYRFGRMYPRLVAAQDRFADIARRDGRIPLPPKGRFRHFRGAGHAPENYKDAMSSASQGGIGEYLKTIMVEAQRSGIWEKHGARLLLSVHDSLAAEVAPGEGERLGKELQEIASDHNYWKSVPQIVEAKRW